MYEPTEEQQNIINSAKNTDDNLLINALAGAAKTSTLMLIAEAIPELEMLCLAFNKKIAVEMQQKLPPNCKAMTLNSLGHRTWSEALGRRLRIETSKGYDIMKGVVEEETDPQIKTELYSNLAELMRIVALGKQMGYIPTDTYDKMPLKAKRLMDDDEFFSHIEQELEDFEKAVVRRATLISLDQAFNGLCDYDDQILMPTVFYGSFPRYKLVLIDEAQDLSALNHAMLRKMKPKRLIAVGDPCQAIYGFRGAHMDSMNLMQQEFSMKEMTLSVSFRCSRAIVNEAKWRAPNMKYPEWAKNGAVIKLGQWRADDLPEAAAIICRNNAPLFSLAIKLLRNGRHVELGGTDVIKSITTVMRKFGSSNVSSARVLDLIDKWEEEQLNKNKRKAHDNIKDRAECMRIFARQANDLAGALAYAQHLVQLHSPLKLMTGHRSKGLEFDHVFFLDQDLIGPEGQDPNVRYVIITRAKETLAYIESRNFVSNDEV